MNNLRVLIIGLRPTARSTIKDALELAGMTCSEAAGVRDAAAILEWRIPDFILLDWLPGTGTLDILRWLKQEPLKCRIPVIVLSSEKDEGYLVRALRLGAEDFVAKPFSAREIIARIRAVHRRFSLFTEPQTLIFGELQIDMVHSHVFLRQQLLEIGPVEYKLLVFFLKHPHRVHSRAQIIQMVWGGRRMIDESSVNARIRGLRKILGLAEDGYGRYLKTVRSTGYCFTGENIPSMDSIQDSFPQKKSA